MYYADLFEIEGQEILLQDRELREAIELDKNNKNKIVVNVLNPPKDIQAADNTGENDSTESINACIEFAANNNGVVFIPNGKYLVSTLVVKNNTTIIGCGCYRTNVIQKGASTKAIITSGSGANNVSIIGVGFDGNDEVQVNDLNGVEISGDNFSVYSCYFTKSSTIIKGTCGGHSTIKNCVFDFCAKKFIDIANSGQLNIENAIFNNISDTAPECCVETSGGNCFIAGCSSYAVVPIAFKISGDNNVIISTVQNAVKSFEGNGKNIVVINGETVDVNYQANLSDLNVANIAKLNSLEITSDTNIKYSKPEKISNGLDVIKMTSTDDKEYNILVVDEKTNFNGMVSVKNFGAVGDGVTDDSEAFSNWLKYIIENSKQGFIPDGEYLIKTGGITYRTENENNWGIVGESVERTILKFSPDDKVNVLNHIDIRYCQNFSMGNFTIECTGGDMQVTGVAIYLVNVSHVNISNIEINNCSRCGVNAYAANYSEGGYCFDLHFENVNIHGVNNNAPFEGQEGRYLYPMGWILSDCASTFVDNCDIDNIAWYGFEFKNYCKNSYFRNCNARHCVTACHIGGELREGDNYAFTSGGYIGITCFDVDTPIVGGSFREAVFKDIVAYYSTPYTWVSKNSQPEAYTARLQNVLNSVFDVTVFNCPYAGVYFSDKSEGNIFTFKTLTVASNFIGRYYNFDSTSINNVIVCEKHPVNLDFIYKQNDRYIGNIISDKMTNSLSNMISNATNKNQNNFIGEVSANRGTFNWASDSLIKTNFSKDNVVKEIFGNLSGNYIRVDYNTTTGEPYIDFKLTSTTGTTVIRIDKTGAHVVS